MHIRQAFSFSIYSGLNSRVKVRVELPGFWYASSVWHYFWNLGFSTFVFILQLTCEGHMNLSNENGLSAKCLKSALPLCKLYCDKWKVCGPLRG